MPQTEYHHINGVSDELILTRARIFAADMEIAAKTKAVPRRSWLLAKMLGDLAMLEVEELENLAPTREEFTIIDGNVNRDTWCMCCTNTILDGGPCAIIRVGVVEVHTHRGSCAEKTARALLKESLEIKP